jgi:hypothetical protein
VETGPGIKAILYSMAEEPYFYLDRAEKAELYIPHTGVCQDMNAGEGACPPDTDKAAFALDVRGTGESMPVTCQRDDYLSAYGGDFLFACAGSMLNEPYLGGKVRDILETIKLLKNAGIKDITLRARGLGAIPALFAALLSDDVGSVVLKNSLLSYHELTQVPACKWPFSHMLYGVLKSFDLPDIFRELEDKGLILLDPWDEKMEVRKKNDCLESARSLGINRKIIKFSKQNKKK